MTVSPQLLPTILALAAAQDLTKTPVDIAASLERAVELANNYPLEKLSPANQGVLVAARKLLNSPSKSSLIGVIESIPEDLLPSNKELTSVDLIKSLKTLIKIGKTFDISGFGAADQEVFSAARDLLEDPSGATLLGLVSSAPAAATAKAAIPAFPTGPKPVGPGRGGRVFPRQLQLQQQRQQMLSRQQSPGSFVYFG